VSAADRGRGAGCQVGERFQQFPDGGDLVGLRCHGDLAEDGADSVRECRDQVRELPSFRRAPPVTRRHAGRLSRCHDIAGQALFHDFAVSLGGYRRRLVRDRAIRGHSRAIEPATQPCW
jgi:hypothetical protein